MGIFNKNKLNSMGDVIRAAENQAILPVYKPESKPEEEWIWVEGYKGTNSEMVCRDMQFDFDQIFISDDAVLCESGFHFCLMLHHVFRYYEADFRNRFFKVRALVRNDSYKKYGSYEYSSWSESNHIVDKLCAKEIEFIEEVSKEELFDYYENKYSFIETVEDYDAVCISGDYESYVRDKYLGSLSPIISETLLLAIYGKFKDYDKMKDFTKYTLALAEDKGISHDLFIYLALHSMNLA